MNKVSVIIPTYNSYKYMEKCLSALENQTYKNFDVVIVDDASKDDTYEKIKSYTKNTKLNLRLYNLTKNSGPGVARNLGILNSTGDWIAFCDSDDWYEDNFLEEMIKEAEKSDADIVMVDYYTAHSNGKKVKSGYTESIKCLKTNKELIAYAKSSLCNLLIKKELLIKYEIPNLYNGEDIAIIPILLSKANKIGVIDKPLYNYYMREASLSNRADPLIYQSLLNAFEVIKANLGNEYIDEIEFIGIEVVLYGVTLTALKAKVPDELIISEINKFKKEFEFFYKNKYYKKYNWIKKIYIKACVNNFLFLNKFFAYIHNKRAER